MRKIDPIAAPSPNRFWFGLERPDADSPDADTIAEARCALANKVLERLTAPANLPLVKMFFWAPVPHHYYFGNQGDYSALLEHGLWLNLDYAGTATIERN